MVAANKAVTKRVFTSILPERGRLAEPALAVETRAGAHETEAESAEAAR
jgi:hypothetical protein